MSNPSGEREARAVGHDEPGPSRSRVTAAAVHVMVFAGGVAALAWEVIWQLKASLAFGVSASGTALTLAAAMGGMTAGALAMGRRLRGRDLAQPLRLYGVLEGVIGVSGLLLLPGFQALEALDSRIYAVAPLLASAVHAFGIALLLAPATAAMGASVPVFQLMAARYRTSIAVLYGMNTAGAATGVLLLSFWLLPSYGVGLSCAIVVAVNAAVMVLAFLLGKGPAPQEPRIAASSPATPFPGAPSLASGLPQLAVFLTGFITFGLEVAWFRALRAAFWSTSSTFAIMLASVLIPLAVGARLVPWLRRRGVAPGTLLLIGGAAVLLATPGVERMDIVARLPLPQPIVLALWLLITLAVIGPAVLCLATILPWFLEEAAEPALTGRLYGQNTLGSVTGSIVAAWGLLPMLGFARTSWVLGLLALAAAALLLPPRRRWRAAAVGAVGLIVAMSFASSPGRDRMFARRDLAGHHIVAFEEGPDFTTAVVENATGMRSLFVDGFNAASGNSVGSFYMRWMGSLPALLHADPQRGLVICFGTGQTANALRQDMDGRVDVVDISRAVLDMGVHFDDNEGVLEDPRVEANVMDGRAWLRRTDRHYDVITLEPMPPNFSGVNSLYSLEFYEIMARRLSADGIAAQWLPIHLLTREHMASISATFVEVFPDSLLWYDPVGGTGILVGRRDGAPEPLGTVWPGFARSARVRDLTPDQIRRSVLLDRKRLARYASAGAMVTDDNQLLQFSQLRAGLRGKRGSALTRQNRHDLVRAAGRIPFAIDGSRLR